MVSIGIVIILEKQDNKLPYSSFISQQGGGGFLESFVICKNVLNFAELVFVHINKRVFQTRWLPIIMYNP